MLNTPDPIYLVDQKVLDIFEKECSGKFQAIPVILQLPDEEMSGYWAINVTNKAPVFSRKDSVKYEEYENDSSYDHSVGAYRTKAFDANIIEEQDLCRGIDIGDTNNFISNRLHAILKKAKIKGYNGQPDLGNKIVFVQA